MDRERDVLLRRYERVRLRTMELAARLSIDEQLAQAFPDASPTKWHLGHTTWFFERFVLASFDASYPVVDPQYEYVFNSYYEAIGARQPRHQRSLAVRPTLEEVCAYRERVDAAMRDFIARAAGAVWREAVPALVLGAHHEEQHQELILTDVKPVRASSRRFEELAVPAQERTSLSSPLAWRREEGGLVEIGWDRERGFAFDNESPRHRLWLESFELASRLVTNREYLEFIESGGYSNAAFWLSDGWTTIRELGWCAPMYWRKRESDWLEHRWDGVCPLELDAPVCHVSYYEADAYARWVNARLPSEAEWELAAARESISGNFLESGALHPRPAGNAPQLFGDVWEWTSSPYVPYPRYRPFEGAFAEYNGKFMSGQMVLRGGSCFTPRAHVRATYRNFFPPATRWQMAGFRIAH
jgi:ergothioneine biosynthesis protein EgtB